MTTEQIIKIAPLICAVISALWATIQIFRFLLSKIKKAGEAFELTLIISIINLVGAILIMNFAHKLNTTPKSFTFILSVLIISTALSIFFVVKKIMSKLKSGLKESSLENMIKSVEKRDRDKADEIAKKESEYLKHISELEAKNLELDRKTRVIDEVPEGFWLLHGKVLYDKENGTNYCWNCWNKIEGGERRVLNGDEYYVKCNVCGIGTQLKEFPQLPNSSIPDY